MTLGCWGANDFGQLGDGTLIRCSTPRPVTVVRSAGAEDTYGILLIPVGD